MDRPVEKESLRFAEWLADCDAANHAPLEINPDSTQQWSIAFDVLAGGWVIGSDKGILWFDNQNLYVVGQLTSFAIPGHRLAAKVEKRLDVFRPLQRAFTIPISCDAPFPLSIQLDVVTAEPYVPENIAFLEALRNCCAHSDSTTEGQLPPIGLHPSAQSMTSLRRRLAAQTSRLALAIGISAVGIGLVMEEIRISPLLGGILMIGAVLSCLQWSWPKLTVLTAAMRSCSRYSKTLSG